MKKYLGLSVASWVGLVIVLIIIVCFVVLISISPSVDPYVPTPPPPPFTPVDTVFQTPVQVNEPPADTPPEVIPLGVEITPGTENRSLNSRSLSSRADPGTTVVTLSQLEQTPQFRRLLAKTEQNCLVKFAEEFTLDVANTKEFYFKNNFSFVDPTFYEGYNSQETRSGNAAYTGTNFTEPESASRFSVRSNIKMPLELKDVIFKDRQTETGVITVETIMSIILYSFGDIDKQEVKVFLNGAERLVTQENYFTDYIEFYEQMKSEGLLSLIAHEEIVAWVAPYNA